MDVFTRGKGHEDGKGEGEGEVVGLRAVEGAIKAEDVDPP